MKPKNVLVFLYPDENHISVNSPQNWNCESCLEVGGRGVLVKLSDFGIGVRVTSFQYYSNAGTTGYRAPEVAGITGATGYNEKVTICSTRHCLTCCMLIGGRLFLGHDSVCDVDITTYSTKGDSPF